MMKKLDGLQTIQGIKRDRFYCVDGFAGEVAGRSLVEREIFNAAIQIPDFGTLTYETAIELVEGKS